MKVSCQLLAPATLPAGTHWIVSLVGPRTSVDMVTRRKLNPGHPAHSLVTIFAEQPWLSVSVTSAI